MARLLLANGVPVDQRDQRGDTALHVLCSSDHSISVAQALAHALLDAGARPTLEDAAGRTPCSLAEGQHVSGGWRDDDGGSVSSCGEDEDSGPSQPELADLLRRRMILSHHGVGHCIVSAGGATGEAIVVAGEGAIRLPEPPAAAAPAEPESEKAAVPAAGVKLTVLLLGPGSAVHSSPERFSALRRMHTLECPDMPEPEDELEACVRCAVESIAQLQPDIILCGSRGE
jgi:hypothetical protein